MSATITQLHPLKALAHKVLERNRERNQCATAPETVRNFTPSLIPSTVAQVASSESEVALEAAHDRVTCLRCANLTRGGVCRARSSQSTNYTPLQYEPVLLWRRCKDYTP